MIKYEPKFGRVLIEREKKKANGIIIPEDAAKRNAPCLGKIIGLGETAGFTETYFQDADGSYQQKTIQTLKVGDQVIFGRHAGAWIDGEETMYICQDQDILLIVKEQS